MRSNKESRSHIERGSGRAGAKSESAEEREDDESADEGWSAQELDKENGGERLECVCLLLFNLYAIWQGRAC